jgi:hypothetical protein
MRKLLLIAAAWLLAGCCSVSDYPSFVEGFYQAVADQDLETAHDYLYSEATIYDQRLDEPDPQGDLEAYLGSLMQAFENARWEFSEMACKGNTITWQEDFCHGEDCTSYQLEVGEFGGEITDLQAILVEE